MIVEHLGFDAEDLGGFLDLRPAAQGERSARGTPMADVTVSDRDEFDFVSVRSPFSGDARGLEFGIIRMRAEADDAELAVLIGGLN